MKEDLISVEPLIKRQLVWDMIPHEMVYTVMQSLNLLPGSEETFELEHLDAHQRDTLIQPKASIILQITQMAVEVVAHYYNSVDKAPDWMKRDKDFEEVQRLVQAVVMGVMTILSTTDAINMSVVNLGNGEENE
jgi:hypothetical protein